MKRNGMCPICFVKRFFNTPSKVSEVYDDAPYNNGVALTPPMGWSSWNTFANRIDQNLIYEEAEAIKKSGLADLGYRYVNIDDNWVCNNRDENGDIQPDPLTFKDGMKTLIDKINALGMKVGVYSSNGTLTCEDLTASLYHECADALTFARWGVEYFKYDFCHNEPLSDYAPLVYALTVSDKNGNLSTYPCEGAKLFGLARFMKDKRLDGGKLISGLDRREGKATFTVLAPEDGEYTVTVHIKKQGKYEKCLMVACNGDRKIIRFPSQKHFNLTAKFSTIIRLKKGDNEIELFNPIGTRADSAMLQYQNMGRELKSATARVAAESGKPEKPIVFSICEWGWNKPYVWGATAGNLWRTTPDIKAFWPWMMIIYNHNVKLYKNSAVGGWNDPDMLEVGNGKLTKAENLSHFALWCMMNSPLILGNDVRKMTPEVLAIVGNKKLIAINQDTLGVQAKRLKKGRVDILVKPLSDGSAAVCLFNKNNFAKNYNVRIEKIVADGYGKLAAKDNYQIENLLTDEVINGNTLSAKLEVHGCTVFKIKQPN